MSTRSTGRISLKESAEGNETVARTYSGFMARRGVVPNMFKVWAHSPRLLEAAAEFSVAMLAEAALPGWYKELIATHIALLEQCEYGALAHERLAAAKGASAGQVAAVRAHRWDVFTERENLGFAYAGRMIKGAAQVDDEFFAEVRAIFSEQEIVELTGAVAGMLCFTRFINTLHVPLTPAPQEQA